MRQNILKSFTGSSLTTTTTATVYDTTACAILGSDVLVPRQPSNTNAFQNTTSALKTAIVEALTNGSTIYGEDFDPSSASFSLYIFSVYEEKSLFTYHYDRPALANATEGEVSWTEPITKYIPELAELAKQHPTGEDEIEFIDWNLITIGTLASQLGEVQSTPRNLSDSDCENFFYVPCTKKAYIAVNAFQQPSLAAFWGPSYSNGAYALFGDCFGDMKNATFESLFEPKFVKQHGLNATYIKDAPTSRGIIPYDNTVAGYTNDLLSEDSAVSFYSSINNMRSLGRAILNSIHLSMGQTNRWLKPHSFTANINITVGAPWEIYLVPIDTKPTWMYTKGGDVGFHSTNFVLLPDYGVSFTRVAHEEAAKQFAGSYTDTTTNGTLIVEVDDSAGLLVSRWDFNTTDTLTSFSSPKRTRYNSHLVISYWIRKQEWVEIGIQGNCMRAYRQSRSYNCAEQFRR
ncbi:beta-lactamase family protein [Halenospora varia]|nr:beta-lactamase family protein [Halenospora varia]